MAKYTIELRKVCELLGRDEVENWFKSYELKNYLTNTQIQQIEKAGVWSKDRLAKKIVDHYFMREIGFETPRTFQTLCNSYNARNYGKIFATYLFKLF